MQENFFQGAAILFRICFQNTFKQKGRRLFHQVELVFSCEYHGPYSPRKTTPSPVSRNIWAAQQAVRTFPEVCGSAPAFRTLLGVCHYAGLGTEQDFKKAEEALRAAADAGDLDAMDFLGCENGRMPDYGMPLEEYLRQCWLSNQ